MAVIPNVSPGNVRGVVDKIVGVYEEAVGRLVGNERLVRRGELHQEAGTKRLEALQHQAKAVKEEAKAASAEAGQRVAQASKEAS